MEEPLSKEGLQELLQELGEEQAAEGPPSPNVEELIQELQSGRDGRARQKAAEQLGEVGTSKWRIVQALIVAEKSDVDSEVRRAAGEALRAPVHQECLEKHPKLMDSAERIVKDMRRVERVGREKQSTKRVGRDKQSAETAILRQQAERCDRKKPGSDLELAGLIGFGLVWIGVTTVMYRSNLPVYVAVFFTLVGAALVAWGLWRWLSPTSPRNLFLASHRQTEGAVTGLDKKKNRSEYGPNYNYYVTVLFEADDAKMGMRVMELKAEVAHGIWKRMKTGDTVGVRYVPQDPRIALIQDELF